MTTIGKGGDDKAKGFWRPWGPWVPGRGSGPRELRAGPHVAHFSNIIYNSKGIASSHVSKCRGNY